MQSTSDQRVVNNVMRHEYKVLSENEKAQMKEIKDAGLAFHDLLHSLGQSRELSIAKTKIEEAVMWAVKHLTMPVLLLLVVTGCAPYIVMHDLGDDSIQEYIKPAKFLEGGFVDRVKCPTKTMRYSDKYKMKICRGMAGDDAYLAWAISTDEKLPGYATQMVSGAMHGMWYVAAAGTLGAVMPGTTVNQSGPVINETFSTKYIGR